VACVPGYQSRSGHSICGSHHFRNGSVVSVDYAVRYCSFIAVVIRKNLMISITLKSGIRSRNMFDRMLPEVVRNR
jgi:hypothetical protein